MGSHRWQGRGAAPPSPVPEPSRRLADASTNERTEEEKRNGQDPHHRRAVRRPRRRSGWNRVVDGVRQPRTTIDLVGTAAAAGKFTTLTKLLAKAGLVSALQKPGPYTVFAPTDAAFAK